MEIDISQNFFKTAISFGSQYLARPFDLRKHDLGAEFGFNALRRNKWAKLWMETREKSSGSTSSQDTGGILTITKSKWPSLGRRVRVLEKILRQSERECIKKNHLKLRDPPVQGKSVSRGLHGGVNA